MPGMIDPGCLDQPYFPDHLSPHVKRLVRSSPFRKGQRGPRACVGRSRLRHVSIVSSASLLDFDVGLLHDLCPAGLFGANETGELVRRIGAYLRSLIAEPLAHLGGGENAADLGVETRGVLRARKRPR